MTTEAAQAGEWSRAGRPVQGVRGWSDSARGVTEATCRASAIVQIVKALTQVRGATASEGSESIPLPF